MLVGGLVAYGAHKMSQKDAERIQQHTGIDPEELTDEELVQAMGELGIEQQTVTEADMAPGGAQATPAPQAAPAPQAPAQDAGSDLDQLQKLADLHASGVLSDEEFAAMKAKILGL